MSVCPCKSSKDYSACCEPVIANAATAATPEALMRSRYTAYALGKVKHLYESYDPSRRHDYDEKAALEWSKSSKWLGLEVLASNSLADSGTVEFIAHFERDGKAQTHHEIAEFKRVEHRWYFVDGAPPKGKPLVRTEPKVGRNDPCPCGSGKKLKKCCVDQSV